MDIKRLWRQVREALDNLWNSKLRSFLAILGILVGTGSVVTLISSSKLATNHALAQFSNLGTNLIAMDTQVQGDNGKQGNAKVQLADVAKLAAASPSILQFAPYTNVFLPVYFRGKPVSNQLIGATESLRDILKFEIAEGRFISDLDKYSYFCVIGDELAKKFRAEGLDPVGKQIQVDKGFLTIVGVLKPWPPNLFFYSDANSSLIVPLQTSYAVSSFSEIHQALFRVQEGLTNKQLDDVQNAIKVTMKKILPKQDISFHNPQQLIAVVGKQRETFTQLLGVVGGISLFVGGIGVMNIMLVSVVERRREIGIRLAIGARQFDILRLFLLEAVTLTSLGGVLGIVIGVVISLVVAILSKWQYVLFWSPILQGFVVSSLVGLAAGFYPAYRAAKSNPIECLVSE